MEPRLEQLAASAIRNAFEELLSKRHLYQSVKVDFSFIPDLAKGLYQPPTKSASRLTPGGRRIALLPQDIPNWHGLQKTLEKQVNVPWIPRVAVRTEKTADFEFRLPTIHATCPSCGDLWPFDALLGLVCAHIATAGSVCDQNFLLPYSCQSCKKGRITYLVRRKQDKLTLVGRDPIEIVKVTKELPKGQSMHFSGAIVAYNSGQVLAAIFMLRVFIEQYWISVLKDSLPDMGRIPGEKLGELYKKLLTAPFKSTMPILVDTYANLSEAIHAADGSVVVFEKARGEVEKHFEALRLFKLDPAELAKSRAL